MASISIQVSSPQNGAVLWGPTSGVWVDVSGTVAADIAGSKLVEVDLGSGGLGGPAQLSGNTWSYKGLVTAQGPLTITATATVLYSARGEILEASDSVDVTVSVKFDTTAPQLTIDALPNGGKVYGDTAKISTTITGTAADSQTGVDLVKCDVDGVEFPVTTASGWSKWSAVCEVPYGQHTVTVRCVDKVGNIATKQVAVEAVDNTAPTLSIDEPPDFFTKLGDETGAKIKISGTATDPQSGVAAIEWALDDSSQYKQATTQTNWAAWSAEVQVPPEMHVIKVRARDKKNNTGVKEKPVRVSLSFQPGDQEDNVSHLAYLRDLIEFARSHVDVALPGGDKTRSLELRDLTRQFSQPFGDLTSNEEVRQLRICIEVLRSYLDPHPSAYWRFDESAGLETLDSSGNGNAGTLQGPTRTAGREGGGALQFDGVDDVVKLDGANYGDAINNFTVAFWANPQATHGIDAQSTSGVGGTSGQRYAIDPPQGASLYDSSDHACAGVSVGTNGISVYEHSDGYMPALLVHQVPISAWTHVAVVYENKQPRLYINGTLAKTGLTSLKKFVHLNPQTLGGMSYGFFKGLLDDVRIYDRALSAVEVQDLFSPLPTGEVAWVEDALPAGATAYVGGGDSWYWVSTNPAPFSGTKAHQSTLAAGLHQHYFTEASTPLAVKRGDKLFAYVYLDPLNVPKEIMLQWNDGTWEHRAYWGSNEIGVNDGVNDPAWGTDGTNSRRYMGLLPPSGEWVRLEVAASQVGLGNRMVSGMAFTLYGGRATWDRAGKIGYQVSLEAAESRYRQAAYQTLLNNLGTSYEELRLARHQPGQKGDARKALASRLGIDLDAAQPDQLDQLLLMPDKITEATLEKLFGLADTTRDPMSARPVPDLLSWRLEHLRTLWKEQDHPTGQDAESMPPIIDPDLVRQEDLIAPTPDKPNPAFTLWEARSAWVNGLLSQLANDKVSGETDKDRLERLVGSIPSGSTEKLSMADLLDLDAERQQGSDIEPELQKKRLSTGAFSYLVRMHKLAAAGSLLDSEWSDVYSILVQVEKLHKYGDWRKAEINLTLSTDYFALSANATTIAPSSPRLPAWRATEQERQAWQNTLRARADQELAVAQGLQAAVDAAEEATLPLLRDALVEAIEGGRSSADVSNWLTDWLQIDVKGTGRRKTTRIKQAIETLQGVLFSLRTNRFKDMEAETDLEPISLRPDWELAVEVASHFDEEWAWMGSYATWRAAMLVFLYPENFLLPSLRGSTTKAFQEQMVKKLRGNHQLTPEQAREAASDYLAALRNEEKTETVWFEDELPTGTTPGGDEPWNWISTNPAPFSGTKAHQSNVAAGVHQHFFHGATYPLWIDAGDKLFAYVYLDPTNVPSEIMLQWYDGTGWEHRAYWGANQIAWGTDGTNSRRRMGDLPKAGGWVRLEVPASQVGLEGKSVSGMAFTLYGGRATWDRAGHSGLPQDLRAADFKITDQLPDPYVQNKMVEKLFGGIKDPHDAPLYLKEAFYFVPMYLALQLQKSRQYTAALDWFRTVYAYNLPLQERKIYHGLELESSIPSSYERVLTQWLLGDDLNPHFVATKRKNAYMRFTLLSVVRCFLDFADSEFTNETDESISRARTLYLSAVELLNLPELQPPKDAGFAPNPVTEALKLHAELNLFKLRDNRNIAGMQRETEPALPQKMLHSLPTIGGGGQLTLPGARILRPTPYRYSALVERAKQLVSIAQQIEAAYLSALDRMGDAGYTELKAHQDLDLAKAGVDLQDLRVTEANGGVTLATLQQQRSQFQADHYKGLIDAGQLQLEKSSLDFQQASMLLQYTSAGLYAASAVASISNPANWSQFFSSAASSTSAVAGALGTRASMLATMASYERRKQEWNFQMNLAQKDVAIGGQQITSAQDRVNVVNKERSIAQTQEINADATVNFLTTKRFATAELYEWMSGVLGGVYSYFLQQATATARLAQSQLAFERQEGVLSIVQADYWQPPSDGAATANGSDGKAPDRRGLTGSARLLQDIYQLDQYAFETDRRKLQLTKTISLAREAPMEFQRFRETGVLPFATPMEAFDRDFPGHYLRLIKRVRTSVIALVPPTQGIRATLATTGVSRVITSGDGIFQTMPVYRGPELVALSSPNNATGLFELDQQSDMLLPFEAMGVDASWELQVPKAANPFDYRTIADVLITIDYTALNSFDYRQQVVQELDRTLSADHPFSLRQQFPDLWYDLHNPDQANPPAMTVGFDTMRDDFPPNIEDLRTQHIVLYIVRSDGQPFDPPLTVKLYFTPQDGVKDGGEATSEDGVFSTRRGNANEWLNKICNKVPEGRWRLELPNKQDMKDLFKNEEIEDILFVITYSGRTPEWPT